MKEQDEKKMMKKYMLLYGAHQFAADVLYEHKSNFQQKFTLKVWPKFFGKSI